METAEQEWPDYVYRAFRMVYNAGGFQEGIERFAQRWEALYHIS